MLDFCYNMGQGDSIMSNFDKAVAKVLAHEGGYVNDPLDRGGETNFGITIGTYERYVGRPAYPDEMRNLSKGNAIAIYKDLYWDAVKADKIINYGVAFLLFDQAVNRGPRNATIQAQRALGIYPDGQMTDALVERLNNTPSSDFIPKFINESRKAYERIVQNNPSQEKFLNGWLKRLYKNEAYVLPYMEEVITKEDLKPKLKIEMPKFGEMSMQQQAILVASVGLLGLASIISIRRRMA